MKGIQEKIASEHPGTVLKSFDNVYRSGMRSRVRYWAVGILVAMILTLFLPWTQNIKAPGKITTLRQEARAQEINSIISGRIVKWYVSEGAFVTAGDTLAVLAEVKDAYLDPELLTRTQEQIAAKSMSVTAYNQKMIATRAQMEAIESGRDLKINQLQNKIKQLQLKVVGDSMDMIAAENDFRIAEAQNNRQKILRDSGLASLVQVEQRSKSFQSALAKKVIAGIKWTNTKTDLINAGIEQQGAIQEYAEKNAKAQSDRASALSDRSSGEADLSKLKNQYANYSIRAGQYYLLAPQSGQITGATKSGINEMVKEGEKLMEIVPSGNDRAVELFVLPLDRPLLALGQKVRLVFDGYPAIVFSGWPESSYGTFSGLVTAIESNVGESGKFRVLVAEDAHDRLWPPYLSLGGGAQSIILLQNVPIGYELWRNINGFPPDYYKSDKSAKDEPKN